MLLLPALALALAAATADPAARPGAAPRPAPAAEAGEPGGPALVLHAGKLLTMAGDERPVVNAGTLVVRDGRIAAVGPRGEVAVPDGAVERDLGALWLMPGVVELHNHVGNGTGVFGPNDINDMVHLTNPGLRASSAVVPDNALLRRGVAGGVTSALFIPGSGTNMGGQGVLLKIGRDRYEDMEIRNPGSLKLAQAGNPERHAKGVGRSFMNWNTRNTFLRGKRYAAAWDAFERGAGPRPEKDPQWEVFRELFSKRTQVSVHTQIYQVVLMTCTMVAGELGLDAYIDHGSFDGYKVAELAEQSGVPAILGPRGIARTYPYFIDTDGAILGMAAEYQKRGHTMIGFNTDCVDNGTFITPPQEELPLQAAVGLRYGLEDRNLDGVAGLTIVPARAAGLGDRMGSLEVGKDADLVAITGDPADPRSVVHLVLIDGVVVYDPAVETRRW